MADDLKKGDHVAWKNGAATAHGTVRKVTPHRVTETIKGKDITRNGTEGNPAVEVRSDKGGTALHKASELKPG